MGARRGESSGLRGRGGPGKGSLGRGWCQELRTAVVGWQILLVLAAAVVLGVSCLSSTPHSLSPQPVHLPWESLKLHGGHPTVVSF